MPPKNKGGSKGRVASKGKPAPNVRDEPSGGKKGKSGPSKQKGKAAATGNEPPLEATHNYRCFVIDINDIGAGYEPLTVEIEEDLVKILTNDSPAEKGVKQLRKINGKLYTPKGGCFLVQLRPGMNSNPLAWVTLLYRWKDLYFEAFHAKGKWFRLRDAEEPLPPRSRLAWGKKKDWQKHLHKMDITSSHSAMGGYHIQIGPIACKKYYRSLLNADDLIAQGHMEELLSGPLSVGAVGISEAMRFGLFRRWVCDAMTGIVVHAPGVEPWVPKEHSDHFTEWGKYSEKISNNKPLERELADRVVILKTMDASSEKPASKNGNEAGSSNSKGHGDDSSLEQGDGRAESPDSRGDGHGLSHDAGSSDIQARSQGGQANMNQNRTCKQTGKENLQLNQATPFSGNQRQVKADKPKTKLTTSEGGLGQGQAVDHPWRGKMDLSMVQQKQALGLSNFTNGTNESPEETRTDGASYNSAAAGECCQRNGGFPFCLSDDLPKEKQDKSAADAENQKGSEKENDKESCAGSKKGHTNTCLMPTWERADTYGSLAVVAAAASVFATFRISNNLTENLRFLKHLKQV